MKMNRFLNLLLVFVLSGTVALAQQQASQAIKRIPPEGVQVSDNDRDELGVNLLALGKAIDGLKQRKDPFINGLLPDVQIYYKAVDYAMRYQEFFSVKDIASGKKLLQEGLERGSGPVTGEYRIPAKKRLGNWRLYQYLA